MLSNFGASKEPKSIYDDMSKEQLVIFASELREHYKEERELREKLTEWNSRLEEVLQQMMAMNTSLKDRITERFRIQYAFEEAVVALEGIAERLSTLAARESLAPKAINDVREQALLAAMKARNSEYLK